MTAPKMTPDQAAQAAALAADFAGVDGASIFGDSANFEPGFGRVKFGALKINDGFKGKCLVQECEIVHYRGGPSLMMGATGVVAGPTRRDDAMPPGTVAGHVIMFAWKNKDAAVKALGLAIMQAKAKAQGGDPTAITQDQITGAVAASIVATQAQAGLEVDFVATDQRMKITAQRPLGGVFTKVTFNGATAQPVPAPAAAAQPAPAAAAQPDPLAGLMAAAAPAAAQPDPLAMLQAAAPAAPQPDPLAMLQAAAGPPAPLTRDAMIARLRQDPRFAAMDFTPVADDVIAAAFGAL